MIKKIPSTASGAKSIARKKAKKTIRRRAKGKPAAKSQAQAKLTARDPRSPPSRQRVRITTLRNPHMKGGDSGVHYDDEEDGDYHSPAE